ncbi:hypothetical protein [Herbaspirillum sp. SJZ107]|uniref:hypothetical protein n=1 Tax=Herbaspirillum sp. SJZ107 TaxID=2572881 RepID=UPI00114E3CF9|nr:hypothetical protein [Herbaspirillum sp. SJZ107]
MDVNYNYTAWCPRACRKRAVKRETHGRAGYRIDRAALKASENGALPPANADWQGAIAGK